MSSHRIRTTTVTLASCAALAAFVAAPAGAVEYAHHVGVGSGANYFGPDVTLSESEVVGYGEGIGCAGIRGYSGVSCESAPGQRAYVLLSGDVVSEPYIHNHSTFTSYFNGWYF